MSRTEVTHEQLLYEFEDVLRSIPNRATIRHELDENFAWFGRAASAVEAWDPSKAMRIADLLQQFSGPMAREASEALRQIFVLLQQGRSDLRLRTGKFVNAAIETGGVFDYFDELRKVLSAAIDDVFFVDPYIDAEVVSRYAPQIQAAQTRLLTSDAKLATLLPAVDAYSQQFGKLIAVRVAANIHDRYVIIDRSACYQSGASFKDGAKRAPTTLTQVTDAFAAVYQTYEGIWAGARPER